MRIITNCLRAALIASLFTALPATVQAQSWQWATAATTTSNSSNVTITATALDGAGNTVVAGYFSGTVVLGTITLTSTGGIDGFVGRLSSTGVWTQAVRAGGSGAAVYINALALDNAGNAVVAGNFTGSTISFGTTTLTNAGGGSTTDIFVARLSSAGAWTQAVRAGTARSESAASLALDAAGHAVVGGTFYGPTASFGTTVLTNASPVSAGVDTGDLFIAHLSPAGTWTQVSGAGGTDDDALNALAVDANGTVSAVGYFKSPTISFGTTTLANIFPQGTVSTAFVARLSSAGAWTQATANTTGSPIPTEVAIDGSGNTVVAGFFFGTTTDFGPFTLTNTNPNGASGDIFVARLNSSGTWTQAIRAGGTDDDRNAGLSLDASGNAYVTGSFRGPSAAFGAITLTNANPASNANSKTDIFVARLSTNNIWTSAVRAGGLESESPTDIAVNSASNRVVLTGQFSNPLVIGPFTFPAPPNTTAYVAQLSDLTLGSKHATAQELVSLTPNPAHGSAQLALPAAASIHPVLVFDALGREVRRQTVPARSTTLTLNVAGLTPGLYVVRYGTATGRLVVE
ncbi:T9SS type A sorting domain-containing protein [Hymenobacter cellulosivorans]|uniref:T9SS type A sorting domain-containing protein n=1 Tax=Hymenobacter cellulosivorans TaxID=2932249 RepID=A0ABY4F917_9BACT|nr:T9SS type A sorting domain-containing protein [Hymenobacter cellulosivorans]UOQ52617.1 T9SS type A sorting domain-containing protein [Hymenobacter cellulosivorans]